MKVLFCSLFAILLCNTLKAQDSEVLSNEKIIKLHKAGFSNDVLKSKIQSSPAAFSTSIDDLIELKKEGITDDVISLIVAKPRQSGSTAKPVAAGNDNAAAALKLESGIYYKKSETEYSEIDPSVLTATKSDNAAQVFISGLINAKLKVSIGGQHSTFPINENIPVIVFVFDKSEKKNLNNDNNEFFMNARSPKEFMLVKFNVVQRSRELTVGKSNAISENSGIDEKSVITFNTEKLATGVYQITPEKPLIPGEYGILFSQGFKKGQSSKVFDFTIK